MDYRHKMNMCQKIHSTPLLLRTLVRRQDHFKELSTVHLINVGVRLLS